METGGLKFGESVVGGLEARRGAASRGPTKGNGNRKGKEPAGRRRYEKSALRD